MSESKERDHLTYVGNVIPRWLRLVWTVFFLFGIYYLASYMWPDLKIWLGNL